MKNSIASGKISLPMNFPLGSYFSIEPTGVPDGPISTEDNQVTIQLHIQEVLTTG